MINWISHRILYALALLKIALVAFFFASFIPATSTFAADQLAVCGGVDLVEKLRTENPVKFAEIAKEASAIVNGRSIFWKIEKPGIAPSYLLGTMHMTDAAVTRLSQIANTALENALTIIIESTETLNPQLAAAAMVKLKHLTFLDQGVSLTDLLSQEQSTQLQQVIESRNIPFPIANRLQPWVIATMISIPVCELEAKRSGKKILDHQIAQHAIDNGKELVGLETTEEQFSAIAGLPQEFHISALKETLALSGEHVENMIATMKALYVSGNTAMLMPFMKAASPELYSETGSAAFQEALINKRNLLMAERAAPYLSKGNAFLAVGALHLPGEVGLVSLLKQQGFSVQAVR